jgi:hypothetical protein
MKTFFSVTDIGAGFDGLLVEGEANDDIPELVSVSKVIDRDTVIGDRHLSFSFPPDSLFIAREFLKHELDVEAMAFDHRNPFGKLLWEMNEKTEAVTIACAQYDKVLSVVISDSATNKTLFAKYFHEDVDKIKDLIVNRKDRSAEDLVFELNESCKRVGVTQRE